MPYYTITDFAAGLDLRRSALTAPEGTMRVLRNAHVTTGGEIEKRAAFIKIADVDAASKGLVEVQGKLYVFKGAGAASTVDPTGPWTVGTMNLATTGGTLDSIIDWDLFDNQVFVTVFADAIGTVDRLYAGVIVPTAQGMFVRTYKTKIFAVEGSVLYFSSVGDPTDWTGTGSGLIDLSLEDSDMTDCIALEVYYDKLAIFSKTACQLWVIDPDPLRTQYVQTLRQAGTIAHRSVLSYGSGDVMYLAPDGIRSLRARNASLAASVSDIGSPLDPLMQELFRTEGESFMSQVISILQPVTGRFWVILPDRVYVLSAFPGPKISAWSEYIPTDENGDVFTITSAVQHLQHVVVRDDQNRVFVYGGTTVQAYDNCMVELEFPFHSGGEPATQKRLKAIDSTATGEWDVYAAVDTSNPTAEDYLGKILGPTFQEGNFPFLSVSTHLSLRMRSAVDGPLTLANMIVHYDKAQSG